MARAAEEEENYWPGFVDALSTIVLVVTFLVIILGIAIFAISTKVSEALAKSQEEAKQVAEMQVEMAASIQQQSTEAQRAEQKANEAAAALAAALASEKTAKDALASKPSTDPATEEALKQAQQVIADQAERIEQQRQATAELVKQVVTLNQSATKAPTQDESVDANNKLLINSRAAIDPTEISVAAQEDSTVQSAVAIESAAAVLTVRFEDQAVHLDEDGHAKAVAFVTGNASSLSGRKVALWSFYDSTTLGLTQAKRSAYFRVLELRNAMLDAGLDTQNIDVNVRPADTAPDIDTVQAFLQ